MIMSDLWKFIKKNKLLKGLQKNQKILSIS
jgi:hypothetical protein